MNQWKQLLMCLFLAQACAFTIPQHPVTRSVVLSLETTLSPTTTATVGSKSSKPITAFLFRRKQKPCLIRLYSASTAVDADEVAEEKTFQAGQSSSESFTMKNATADTSTTSKSSLSSSRLELPWSEFHDWALRDNLPKYTRTLPGVTSKTYALWRTMLQDVPELSGYPIDFLQMKYAQPPLKREVNITTATAQALDVVPEKLAFLNNFYFEPSGGLSGQVYGVPGLRDGTTIETAPVGQVEVTIPLGYVLTEDIGIAYELGKPLEESASTLLDGATRTAGRTMGSSLSRTAVTSNILASTTRQGIDIAGMDWKDPDGYLVKLGASTGLLLAGATAVNMLSHHLTVNVFWV